MQKYYCDFCNIELESFDVNNIYFNHSVDKFGQGVNEYQLCDDCMKKAKDTLEILDERLK